MRRRPLIWYLLLAFGVTWLCVLPLVLGSAVPAQLHALGALGPVGAAVVVTRVTGGSRGLSELWRSMSQWRAGPWWLVIVLGSPLALFALSAAVTRPTLTALSVRGVEPEWWLAVGISSVAYGFGEEPGWRGFVLPRLQRRYSALTATAILAGIWAAWHAPFFAYRYRFEGAAEVAGFVVTLFAGALWLTFLYNSTGGSILAVSVWHVLWNVLNLAFGEAAPRTVMVANVMMLAVGAAVVWLGTPARLCWSSRRDQRRDARDP